jgi:flavodoxin
MQQTSDYRGKLMSKVLVLCYSSYGHIEVMANAVAEGPRQAGAQVDINGASLFGFEEQGK